MRDGDHVLRGIGLAHEAGDDRYLAVAAGHDRGIVAAAELDHLGGALLEAIVATGEALARADEQRDAVAHDLDARGLAAVADLAAGQETQPQPIVEQLAIRGGERARVERTAGRVGRRRRDRGRDGGQHLGCRRDLRALGRGRARSRVDGRRVRRPRGGGGGRLARERRQQEPSAGSEHPRHVRPAEGFGASFMAPTSAAAAPRPASSSEGCNRVAARPTPARAPRLVPRLQFPRAMLRRASLALFVSLTAACADAPGPSQGSTGDDGSDTAGSSSAGSTAASATATTSSASAEGSTGTGSDGGSSGAASGDSVTVAARTRARAAVSTSMRRSTWW
ncbi:MAG: hypothetical protein IPN32_07920 [Deltaproteobacteria bacterium]|nr:hypothetical protein [Deltaproteobacteria bacterium]